MAYAFRPNAVTEIAGRTLTAAQAGLQRLDITLGLGCHGWAVLSLWPGSRFADAAPGDALTLALGPMGDEVAVLTGTVSARRQEAGAVVIEALDLSGTLGRARSTLTFEATPIADIVQRLADVASLKTDTDTTEELPIYYVQADRPLWDHLRDLARLTGRDLGVDAAGVLLFRKPDAGATHTLRYGAELIRWQVSAAETPVPLSRGAHGTASQSGNWHWIDADPLGEAPGAACIDGALNDRDLAAIATDAATGRAARAAWAGWLLVTGDAALRPADSIAVTGLPGGDPAPLRIRSVRHRLDGATGFTTWLDVESGGIAAGPERLL